MIFLVFCLVAITIGAQTVFDPACTPFGLRLSYGEYYTQLGGSPQIYVAFNTYGYCPNSYVGFGNLAVYSVFNCTTNSVSFSWQTAPYFNNTVYTCGVSGINFASAVLYTAVGVDNQNNSQAWMGKNATTTIQDRNTINPTQFLVFGDWNYWNNYNPATQEPFPPITNCLNILSSYSVDQIQGIIFTGDQAYNLDSNNGTNYVQFLTLLEPYSSIWPFMAVMGNRESNYPNATYIYSNTYTYPFQYLGQSYYHFVLGSTTFISFDPTQIVYNTSTATTEMQQLLQYINQTLSASTTLYNIVFSHYPFICSAISTNPSCSAINQSLYPIQQLLYQYGVQLYLSGHVHSYEREYPVTLEGQLSSTNVKQYNNLAVPIYIIEGAAGNTNSFQNTPYPLQNFTVVAEFTTGFGMMNITGEGIFYRHIIASNCSVADSFSLTYIGIPALVWIFPIWLIVLLSVIGAAVIGVMLWYFCYYRKRQRVPQPVNEGHYQQFEVGSMAAAT